MTSSFTYNKNPYKNHNKLNSQEKKLDINYFKKIKCISKMKKIKTLKNSKTQELHYFRVSTLKHDLAIIQPFLNWKTDTIAIFSDFKKPFSFKKYFVTDILYKGYQIDNKKIRLFHYV